MAVKPMENITKFIEKKAISGIIIGLICFIFIGLFSFTDIYESFENRFYDMRFGIKPAIDE